MKVGFDMKELPLISVLLSVYNGGPYLKEAIDSIIVQTYSNWELILIDDGSTDESAKIITNYAIDDARIVFIQKDNTGLSDSLNVGLRHAKGKWIARLDADDIAMPDRLEQQLRFVEENSEILLLGGGCIEIDEAGVNVKEHSYPPDHDTLMKNLRYMRKVFPHSSAFFNRQMAMDLDGYNLRFSRSQDRDLWLRIGEIGRIACLHVPAIKLRKHYNMISNTNNGRLQMIMEMCAVICHLCRKEGLSDPSLTEENRWKEFLERVGCRMEEKGVFQERKSWQAIRNSYYNYKGNKFEGAMAVANHLIKNPKSLKAIWWRFFKIDFTSKLAEELCFLD